MVNLFVTIRCLGMLGLLLILKILVLSRVVNCVVVDADFLNYGCDKTNITFITGSKFEASLNDTIFTILPSKASMVTFSNFTTGLGTDTLYALFLCRLDINLQDCHDCVGAAAKKIVFHCPNQKEAIVWYQQCMLRYANHSIFYTEELSPNHKGQNKSLSDYYLTKYNSIFQTTMDDLIQKAAHNTSYQGFAVSNQIQLSSEQSLHGLVQCTPDILGEPCEDCLKKGLQLRQSSWDLNIMLLPSCFIRYDVYGSPPPPPPTPPGSNKRKLILIILPSVASLLLLLGGLWFWKSCCSASENLGQVGQSIEDSTLGGETPAHIDRGRTAGLTQFSFFELDNITNGFYRKLGQGGFGTVYLGRLTDGSMEVAVKVLFKDAPKQFSTEIEVFGKISHKNLVSLVGYCEDETNLALVYEYMAKGDLKAFLSEPDSSSWTKRLLIAIDSAQGLDYLHNGCRPPIVHRDVKSPNILLNQEHRAKIADFGFSKIFPDEYASSVLSSRVIGSPGYVDPQYHSTGQLTEKSDVYSFGVVLLELITGKGATVSAGTTLVHWVKPMLETGDIKNIVDPKLHQIQDRNSIWRAIDLAMECVSYTGAERPTMSEIVTGLKECLSMEMDLRSSDQAPDSTEMMTAVVTFSAMSPTAR